MIDVVAYTVVAALSSAAVVGYLLGRAVRRRAPDYTILKDGGSCDVRGTRKYEKRADNVGNCGTLVPRLGGPRVDNGVGEGARVVSHDLAVAALRKIAALSPGDYCCCEHPECQHGRVHIAYMAQDIARRAIAEDEGEKEDGDEL
jgi:hypothetical protein